MDTYRIESTYDFEDKEKKHEEQIVLLVEDCFETKSIAHFDVSQKKPLEELLKHLADIPKPEQINTVRDLYNALKWIDCEDRLVFINENSTGELLCIKHIDDTISDRVDINVVFEHIEQEITVKKPVYPYKQLTPKVQAFIEKHGEKIQKEGWLITDSDSAHLYEKYDSDGTFYRVEIDNEAGIIKTDKQADSLAKKLGLVVGENGEVLEVPDADNALCYVYGEHSTKLFESYGTDESFRYEIRDCLIKKTFATNAECDAYYEALKEHLDYFCVVSEEQYNELMFPTTEDITKGVIKKLHKDFEEQKHDAINNLVEQLAIRTNTQEVLREYLD